MNKAKLKSYAPAARRDFIQAVTQRANLLGLSVTGVTPVQITGDIAMINGRPWPAKFAQQRELLVARIKQQGFDAVMEAEAYGWFNRFAALRFMELHGYLDHGYRVLSNQTGVLPEILDNAVSLDGSTLPGLDRDEVIRLKLDGNKDNELYRLLLTTQCNALASSMGFLFEKLDDETELLLPDNLLNTDSVIAKLVQAIPEEDWAEVEIIGWLYQFYISEKKDQVIGKVVKSEDIPAATQLFTPNWIVQYLVQNSVGRLWLMANPASTLASQWPYYIQPAEQTPEVQAQLDALIQTRMDEDGGSLNPETITVLDPACGSGHILVVAYDVLKAIYLERGYQARAIPRLILEKNLYGLDIDDRAAQMAGFALLMKARADDRRLFIESPKLNIFALQESKGLHALELHHSLVRLNDPNPNAATVRSEFGDSDLFPGSCPQMMLGEALMADRARADTTSGLVDVRFIHLLVETFTHAKTFGSLIQIPPALNTQLPTLASAIQQALQSGDLCARAAALDLHPLVAQAKVLGMQFDAVVANPPYMGGGYQAVDLKKFLQTQYVGYEKDLFSAFISRDSKFARKSGFCGFMSPFVWMFISSYGPLRDLIVSKLSIQSLIQLEYNASGDVRVPLCVFMLQNSHTSGFAASFIRLSEFPGQDIQGEKTLEAIRNPSCGWLYRSIPDLFRKIPTSPIAYWASARVLDAFEFGSPMGTMATTRKGMSTGKNARFVRHWSEIEFKRIGLDYDRDSARISAKKWFPYANGGSFRKWYGNIEDVVDWENDGEILQTEQHESGRIRAVNLNLDYIFKEGIFWSDITSASVSARVLPRGSLFSSVASSLFSQDHLLALSIVNSVVANSLLKIINPTLHFNPGDIGSLPVPAKLAKYRETIIKNVHALVNMAKADWNSSEIAWGFEGLHWVGRKSTNMDKISNSWTFWSESKNASVKGMKEIEEQNNHLFIEAYGFQDELSPEVPENQIMLARPAREKDCQRMISYAVGCMMGRYSLDEPGLIYAHAGNVGFDAGRHATFPADADGIVPITDELWFTDDAASRMREFLLAVWGADTLEENMAWLAESLGAKASEAPDETIRRYLVDKFFKDHLQTYKKRPIYWLFSSGKHGAFQALVYLHRYNEGTLSRMRNEYLIPLAGKFGGRADLLQNLITAASTTSERSKLQKELDSLKKKQLELNQFDEQLRHHADQRISLDLDDGVKVNYGKFGNLLAEVKTVTGGAADD